MRFKAYRGSPGWDLRPFRGLLPGNPPRKEDLRFEGVYFNGFAVITELLPSQPYHRGDNPSVRRVSPVGKWPIFGGDTLTELLPCRETSSEGTFPSRRTSRDFLPVRKTDDLPGIASFLDSALVQATSLSGGVPLRISVTGGSCVMAGNCFQAKTSDTSGGPSVADLCPGGRFEKLSASTGIASSQFFQLVKVDTPLRGSPLRRIIAEGISPSRNCFRSDETPNGWVSPVGRHLRNGISNWMGNLPSENRFPSGFPS